MSTTLINYFAVPTAAVRYAISRPSGHARLPPVRAAAFGFEEVASETITYRLSHLLPDYADNLMTHSNVIRVVDGGKESAAEARTWLQAELAAFFPGGRAELTHEATI